LSTRIAVVQGEVVSYLDELLAGYRQGLADDPPTPIAVARAELNRAVDPNQRGRLLAAVAKALTDGTPATSHKASVPLSIQARPAVPRIAQPRDHPPRIAACG
jgi:hypothetical protein